MELKPDLLTIFKKQCPKIHEELKSVKVCFECKNFFLQHNNEGSLPQLFGRGFFLMQKVVCKKVVTVYINHTVQVPGICIYVVIVGTVKKHSLSREKIIELILIEIFMI